MLVEGIAFLAVAVLAAYIVLLFAKWTTSPYEGDRPFYSLSTPNQVVLPSSSFSWSQPCSVRFVIQVTSAPKTISQVDCIEVAPDVRSFGPSCADSSFKPCMCSGTDCSPCSISKVGPLQLLLSLGDHVQLWASGYTSQNDKGLVPAMLKVRTGTGPSQHFMESVPLPAIPLQKWTAITLVKEGRRFDIYYGAKLEASVLTRYVPIEADSTLQWVAGNPQWQGYLGLFHGIPSAVRADEVKKDMDFILNTRGIPYLFLNPPLTWPTLPSIGCPFGDCGSMPAVTPPNPFTVYQTSVA